MSRLTYQKEVFFRFDGPFRSLRVKLQMTRIDAKLPKREWLYF